VIEADFRTCPRCFLCAGRAFGWRTLESIRRLYFGV